jgi:hypothetical protein
MFKARFKSKTERLIAMGLALIGLAHFSLSMVFWVQAIAADAFGQRPWVAQAVPAFLFFAIFLLALLLARKGLRVTLPILVATYVIAGVYCTYDLSHHHYQLRASRGEKSYFTTYLTWWWHEDFVTLP